MARFFLILFLLFLCLFAVALISVLSAEDGQTRRLPRGAWVAIVVLVPAIGPILYLWLGRPSKRRTVRVTARSRPLAPDDDPEFLASLRKPKGPAIGGSASE